MLLATLFLLLQAAPQAERVTVSTKKGDVIEGLFRGATTSEITVEVAGQPLRLPVTDVKYLSFVGRLDASSGPATAVPAAGSMQDAFAALADLQGALRVGVLRAQYSEKLVQTLPRVLAFIDGAGSDWPDVQRALLRAVHLYKAPLGEITKYSNPWERASSYFASASEYVAYAELLGKDPAEKAHSEAATEMELAIGNSAHGRLGNGDRKASKDLDSDSDGSLADVYRLRVSRPGKLTVTGKSAPCTLRFVLVDSTGKKVTAKDDELKRDVNPGEYRLWVVSQGGPGRYSIATTLVP